MSFTLSVYLDYSNRIFLTNISNQEYIVPLERNSRMPQLGEISRITYSLPGCSDERVSKDSERFYNLAKAFNFKGTYKKSSILIPSPVIFFWYTRKIPSFL